MLISCVYLNLRLLFLFSFLCCYFVLYSFLFIFFLTCIFTILFLFYLFSFFLFILWCHMWLSNICIFFLLLSFSLNKNSVLIQSYKHYNSRLLVQLACSIMPTAYQLLVNTLSCFVYYFFVTICFLINRVFIKKM